MDLIVLARPPVAYYRGPVAATAFMRAKISQRATGR